MNSDHEHCFTRFLNEECQLVTNGSQCLGDLIGCDWTGCLAVRCLKCSQVTETR